MKDVPSRVPVVRKVARWWLRHHRFLFLSALYVAYLAALYGVAGVHDRAGQGSRTLMRLVLPAVELGLCGLLCAACLRMARKGPRLPWSLAGWAIAALAAVVYFSQVASLWLSGNFITALALENADSAAFVTSPALYGGAALALAWWGLFCVASWMASAEASLAAGVERWRKLPLAAGGFALGLLFVYGLLLQGKNQRLEPGFRQAPMTNLTATLTGLREPPSDDGDLDEAPPATAPAASAATASAGLAATAAAAGAPAAPPAKLECFAYGDDAESSPYPFQRKGAYLAPLPFPARDAAAGRPNVVVIFSEGVSARAIGAYGGRFPGLTPNIDALAAKSMRVDNYFNHTAATFRGLAGQLSSGYSHAGGGGASGWTKPGNQAGLLRIERQTIPRVVRDAGYQSYFFAPHHQKHALELMLGAMGFDRVFASESIDRELLHGAARTRPGTGALTDQSLFRGLVAFLEARAKSGNDKPFLAATYNIGTHAFLASSGNDVHYAGGDGNAVLDKFHNFDSAFGEFLRYFEASPYAANTVLVFTADHATYPDPVYREVAGSDLKPYFVDRIPLLVLDPRHRLPRAFDAQGRNSLDFAPTLLQLIGVQAADNAFLGASLFEPRRFPLGIASISPNYYMTNSDGVYAQFEVPDALRRMFQCEVGVVRRFYKAESENRIFHRPGSGAPARSR